MRVGVHGQVGRFWNPENLTLSRSSRVLCRTTRGLEMGEIISPSSMLSAAPSEGDGRILRRMGAEDELLRSHLVQLANEVHDECATWLQNQSVTSILLDVEPLMDGKTLYFHFLTPQTDEIVQKHLDYLAARYEQQVAQSEFAKLLSEGCGPGCGTDEAVNGCGSRGGCKTCSLIKSCKKT